MLIPGVPLEIKVEQPNHTFITYATVESVPDVLARAKVQKILSSRLLASKITIKLG